MASLKHDIVGQARAKSVGDKAGTQRVSPAGSFRARDGPLRRLSRRCPAAARAARTAAGRGSPNAACALDLAQDGRARRTRRDV
jgi:hypothetical protein